MAQYIKVSFGEMGYLFVSFWEILRLRQSDEGKEGINAFLEKRKAS